MKKKIAIVTGASSGMGREFAKTIPFKMNNIDEIWLIARNKELLKELQEEIIYETKVISLDLTREESFTKLSALYKKEDVEIVMLVNAAGYGIFDSVANTSFDDNIGMIDLNVTALTKMCLISIPRMTYHSSIINFASVAAFQPVPYINIYAATKAYVLSFSRSLNRELLPKGIKVMAVCPYWTKTNFFKRAVTSNNVVKKYVAMYNPKDIITRAFIDLKKGKDVSKYGFIARAQIGLCKILPHKLIMSIWMYQQKLNEK